MFGKALGRILESFYRPHLFVKVVVAEWLRRWTRNPLGSPRAGSNPADYEEAVLLCFDLDSKCLEMIFWQVASSISVS